MVRFALDRDLAAQRLAGDREARNDPETVPADRDTPTVESKRSASGHGVGRMIAEQATWMLAGTLEGIGW